MATATRVGRGVVRFARYADEPVLHAIDKAAKAGPVEHRRALHSWNVHTHLRTVSGRAVGYLTDRIRQVEDHAVLTRLVVRPGPHALDTERALLATAFGTAREEATGFAKWADEARLAIPVADQCRTSDVRALATTQAHPGVLADALEEAGESRPWLLRALRYGDELAERIARAVGLGLEV